MLHQRSMNPLIEATVEAVEEAILNALVAAETMTGYRGSLVHALPGEELRKLFNAD
jgi:D-aminopeptidase